MKENLKATSIQNESKWDLYVGEYFGQLGSFKGKLTEPARFEYNNLSELPLWSVS